MSAPVIRVEQLSKRYRLQHQAGGSFRYVALRDVLAEKARRLLQRRPPDSAHGPANEDFWALQEVSFDLAQGERLGIIGRNGAGKSTLLKILSRITEPTRGTARIRGRVASLLEVGTGFHPELTGRENIFLNGAILGMSRTEIQARFDEIVAFAEIEKFLDTPVKRYSSGMYVRLAFAVAAHLEPEILIVDEVLAVGDAAFQKKCLGKMEDVTRAGRTLLFVSHNMPTVQHLCSRVLHLHQGRLRADGQPAEVISGYLNLGLEPDSAQTLLQRTDREGTGEYRFAKVWLTDENGQPTNQLVCGRPGTIHALILPASAAARRDAYASVIVHDRFGTRLTTLASALKNQPVTLNGPTEVIWQIERLPLVEGGYSCGLYAGTWRGVEVLDRVWSAFRLEVSAGDFFGTGQNQSLGADRFYVTFDVTSRPHSESPGSTT
jgi:lipopolysaccharide transport system ATP-binding protein